MSSLREVPGKMFQLAENRQEAGRELRDCVVETLQELMKDDDKITALEADLGGASGFTKRQIQSVLFSVELQKLI